MNRPKLEEPGSPEELKVRIRRMRTEIILAEQKKRGLESAIQARYKTLSRLTAQLAMCEPSVGLVANE